MTAPAIEIENLSYRYRSDWLISTIIGLKSLTLTVFEGESFGFLGHNGAGKTTTIKCLLNLIKPVSGSVKIFGADSREVDARKSVGYLPEQPYFYDHLTVNEMMEMYAALAGVPRDLRASRIKEALDLVKVSARSKAPMRSLSKGLVQRAAMAQAIVHHPRLLVLDEPFSGLDPIGRREFSELLLHLKSKGTTIFMSSHILKDVEFLCERVSILRQGVLQGVFKLDELPVLLPGRYELVLDKSTAIEDLALQGKPDVNDQGKFLRLVFEDQAHAEEALARAIETGCRVESFQFVHGGLEELFVRLVNQES